MIYTLTTNPAIDMNIISDDIVPGKVNRTRGAVYSPNGKGINVSFVLQHFGVVSEIIGFFGGFSGEYICKECHKKGFIVHSVNISGTTRINVFVELGNNECKLVNEGPFIDSDSQKKLLDILNTIDNPEMLVISGSLGNGIDDEYYEEILKSCAKQDVKIVLDISSGKLKDLLKYRPYLIKPNNEEIKEIFGLNVNDEKSALTVLKMLNEKGAENILLTLGEKGSYFYNGKNAYFCDIYPVNMKSSACAGDAYLGAFLSSWYKCNNTIEESLKVAAAAGANVAESNGLGDLKKVFRYKEKISVRKIEEEHEV